MTSINSKTPIESFLENAKPHATTDEDVAFYMDRLHYYQCYLEMEPRVEKALGYGEIRFEIDRRGIVNSYDFWLNAMLSFIEHEAIKARNGNGKSNPKK
jgi:hypothetical protein